MSRVLLLFQLPVSIKKMMQGSKVSWEYHPLFINSVSLTLSNSAQTNMAFVPLPSSQYTASVMPQNHGAAPYYCFAGQHITPLGNIHAPLKGPTANSSSSSTGGAVVDAVKPAESTKSSAEQQQVAPPSHFAGVFKDRNKWCAVLEVPHRFASQSEGYHVTSPLETRQIFLGRFDHVEEARYVYKKMDSDWRSSGTFSTKRLARTLRSSGFTSIASNLNSANSAAAHGMSLSGLAGAVGGGAVGLDGKPLMSSGVGAAGGAAGIAAGLMNKLGMVGGAGTGVPGSSSSSLYKTYQPPSKPGMVGTGAAPQMQQRVGASYAMAGGTGPAAPQGQWTGGTAAGGMGAINNTAYNYSKPLPLPQQQAGMKGGMAPQQVGMPRGQVPPPQQMPLQQSYGKPQQQQQMMQSLPMQSQQQPPPQQQYLPPPPNYSYPSGGVSSAPLSGPNAQPYSTFGFAPVQSYYSDAGAAGTSLNLTQPPLDPYPAYSPQMAYSTSTYAPPPNYTSAPPSGPYAAPPPSLYQQQPVPGYSSALSAAGMTYSAAPSYAPAPSNMANNNSSNKTSVVPKQVQQNQMTGGSAAQMKPGSSSGKR